MTRYLALGDSYTVAEGIPASESFPAQLVQALRKRDVAIEAPKVVATTGWTTADLLTALKAQPPEPPYDLISLLIGVNNQYQGLPLDSYATEFEELLHLAMGWVPAPERVFVLSIPDWGVTPFATAQGRDPEQIRQQIQAFNAINARLSYQAGVQYLQITEISREARRGALYLAEDGLHYSGKMYTRWVEQLFPRVWRVLYPELCSQVPLTYHKE